VVLLDRPVEIAEAAGLLGATRGVVPWIEIDDHVLAGEIGQRDLVSVRVLERERRRLLSFLDRHVVPPALRVLVGLRGGVRNAVSVRCGRRWADAVTPERCWHGRRRRLPTV